MINQLLEYSLIIKLIAKYFDSWSIYLEIFFKKKTKFSDFSFIVIGGFLLLLFVSLLLYDSKHLRISSWALGNTNLYL